MHFVFRNNGALSCPLSQDPSRNCDAMRARRTPGLHSFIALVS